MCLHVPKNQRLCMLLFCLSVCEFRCGDIDCKTNLFSIRKNILCKDSCVFRAGLDYSSIPAFKVCVNTASLTGAKSTRPPNIHCQISSFCQFIPLCLYTLFAIKKHQTVPVFFQASVCLYIGCTQTHSKADDVFAMA